MILSLPYKTKQFFVVLIKLSIVLGAFYFVYYKLTSNQALEIHNFIAVLHKNELFSINNVLFLITLTIFNWFFEILKWKHLVSSITFISFKNAMEQSLGALTASLLTPNRIGEYGAKAFYFPKLLRKKIMLLNLISNMMQMTTTTVFGIIGLLFFTTHFSMELNIVKLSLLILTFILIFLGVIYTLKTSRFKIKGFSFEKIREFLTSISLNIKIKGFLFSIIRYLIFSFQFYFLLQIFSVDITYLTAMIIITTMYLLTSVVPSIFIFDVVIKGSAAVYLFSVVSVNDLTILCIVTLMWVLNFVIPSMFGSYYVLNFNFPKAEVTP